MDELRAAWRTPEIEEYSNLYFIHPISSVLAQLFARWGWSPHMVSGLGLLSAFIAAYCFYHYHLITMSILGFIFMLGWHILDGADGQLARLTGQSSELGKIIDGVCDHAGFGMVYVALALSMQDTYGPWIWLLAFAAGLSHLWQASALEFHRDNYDCWVHQRFSKCIPCLDESKQETQASQGRLDPFDAFYLFYLQLQYHFAGADRVLLSSEPQLRDHPKRDKMGEDYKVHALDSVWRWTLLSANKRTFAVTLCCMIKLPILFFLYEIIVLNVMLWWVGKKQRATNMELRHAILGITDQAAPE